MRRAHAGALAWGAVWLTTAALLLTGLMAAPSPASATEVSSARLGRLAANAADGDQVALGALGGVTSVDGRPALPGDALQGAQGSDLKVRLRELALAAQEALGADPGDAGAVAPAKQGAAGDGADSGGSLLGGLSLGLPPLFAILLLVGILVGTLLAARAIGRRRVLEVSAATASKRDAGGEGGAGALERRAKAAEKAGDFATAVRLRFAAGLIRLDDAGAISLRPSLTPAAAARESGSVTLGALAATYSGVLYGGRPAGEPEARAARDGWPHALREAAVSR